MYPEELDELNILDTDEDFSEDIPEDVREALGEIDTGDLSLRRRRSKREPDAFAFFCKKWLSSLIARTSKYAIFGFDKGDDSIILISGRNKLSFEDYLLQYTPGDLGIHIVQMTDTEGVLDFKERLCIPDDRCMLIDISILRKAINMAMRTKHKDKLPVWFIKDGNNNLYIKYVDVTVTDNYGDHPVVISFFGKEYTDWRTICILRDLLQKMRDMVEHPTTCDSVQYHDLVDCINQNLLYYPVFTSRYVEKGYPTFPNYDKDHKTPLIYIDGKDIVSLKEYVKKQKNSKYTLQLISAMSLPNTDIHYCSTYRDDSVYVISSRPLTSTYPYVFSSSKE